VIVVTLANLEVKVDICIEIEEEEEESQLHLSGYFLVSHDSVLV